MIASLVALALAAAPTSLTPSGPWRVEAEDDLCLLSHGFGPADAKVTLGFQPLFTDRNMELLILAPDRTVDPHAGRATVTLLPSGRVVPAQYVSVQARDHLRRLTRLTVSSDVMGELARATVLTVTADRMAMSFQLPPSGNAVKAMDSCQHDLLVSWGVDPALVDQAHAPQPHDAARWFGPDAYPPEAYGAGVTGRVISVLQVDAGGSVRNCRVVSGAGDALNTATCASAMKIRFTPAHDDAGKAVGSIYVLPVRWVLPDA